MAVKILNKRVKTSLSDKMIAKLDEMFAKDERLLYMDCALARASGAGILYKKYGDRAIDCGIQEANMVGVAAGTSIAGKIPFIHTFSIFIARRACDQLFLSGSYNKANVKCLATDPGISATTNGGTHMPFEDMAIIRAFPEMTLLDVCDPVQLRSILEQMANTYGMMYCRIPRSCGFTIYEEGSEFQIGKANLLRDGSDVTIIASGIEVADALDAADLLEKEGVSVRVVDMFTIKPIDKTMILESAELTGAIVTAENANIIGGLGSAVAEVLGEEHPTIMERVGVKDLFGEVGSFNYLKQRFNLRAEDIAAACRRVILRKQGSH